MSILFLDVDGVLNHRRTRQVTGCGCTGIDPDNAKQLRRVLKETGCAIVLSSTWRKYRQLVHELWRGIGVEAKERCLGFTPILDGYEFVRGHEIQSWLNSHDYSGSFVIVDDDSDMAHLTEKLVKTDNNFGLTEKDADEIIRRLNE